MGLLDRIFEPAKYGEYTEKRRRPVFKHKASDAYLDSDKLLAIQELIEEDSSGQIQTGTLSQNSHKLDTLARIAIVTFAGALLFFAGYLSKHQTDEQCGRQLSIWSPLSDAVEYEEIDFVNKPDQPSMYMGAPTRKLEEEWEKLWFYGTLSIPENKMHLLNRSGNDSWDVQYDGSGYRALTEVFHQLHCLDVIRQYTWREYYPQHPDEVKVPFLLQDDVDQKISRDHTDHCIEALRLSIMCHGDVTPYLLKVNPTAPQGVDPDFSMHHKCVKFDTLVEFMKKQPFAVKSHNPHKREVQQEEE